MVSQAGVGRHPVFNRNHREVSAVVFAGFRVERQGAGRTMAAAEVVHADDKELVGVERFAGANDVIPPADVLRLVGVNAGDVMAAGEGVAYQHGVRACRVQSTVGFINEFKARERSAAFQRNRLVEADSLRSNYPDRMV